MGADGTDKPIDKEVEGILSSSWGDGDAEHQIEDRAAGEIWGPLEQRAVILHRQE